MKNILFLLLLLPFLALAQNEKVGSPISPLQSTNNQQQTYAVVVGISDDQDNGIPDLRLADRDAEARSISHVVIPTKLHGYIHKSRFV